MKWTALMLLALLAGCGDIPSREEATDRQIARSADINARAALQRLSDLESRIEALESDKSDLEDHVSDLEAAIELQRVSLEDYKNESVEWHHKHHSR